MTWANFGILGVGGLLLCVPIILHFMFQPKPVSVDFPALRFLKQKQQSTRSRMRLKHIALLLIRCLLIALLTLALAGPSVASSDVGNWLTLGGVGTSGLIIGLVAAAAFFRQRKNWLLIGILGAMLLGHLVFGAISINRIMNAEDANLIGDPQAPVAALIVMDTSPRMQLEFENENRLQKAREIGQWLVTQFPSDSQVCVAPTDSDGVFFSVDVGAADRRIGKLKTNFSGVKIPSKISQGLDLLETSSMDRKEIYVVTDLTTESWTGENTQKLIRQLKRNPEYSLFVIDVGVDSPSNFSLAPLQLSASEISANGNLNIHTEIRRSGSAGQRTVKMQVEKIEPARPVVRDRQTLYPTKTFIPQTKVVDVRENGNAGVQFSFSQPLTTGTYHGSIRIEGQDGLDVDDKRYFTFRVRPPRNTLIVHPDNVKSQPVVFLLAPSRSVAIGTNRFECEVVTQAEFDRMNGFAKYDAVFVLDPKPIAEDRWELLQTYVENGGGLGLFLGPNANDNGFADAAFTTETAQHIIGGRLEQQWFDDTKELTLSPPEETSHPIFRSIRGSETSILWNRFPITKFWGIVQNTTNDSAPTQTLLRYTNREPAVIERTLGKGRVLTMTTPVTEFGYYADRRSWNALLGGTGLEPVPWYLLVKGVVSHLVQSDADALNVQVGQVSTLQNNLRQFPDAYQVFSPIQDRPPASLNSVENQIRFRFNDYPGHYRFRGVFDDQVILRGFSSNLPLAATDLSRVGVDVLDETLGPGRYQLANDKNQITRQQGTTRRGQELYPFIVVMMIVILGLEYLMSNRFY